jgi:hypothetical protein
MRDEILRRIMMSDLRNNNKAFPLSLMAKAPAIDWTDMAVKDKEQKHDLFPARTLLCLNNSMSLRPRLEYTTHSPKA